MYTPHSYWSYLEDAAVLWVLLFPGSETILFSKRRKVLQVGVNRELFLVRWSGDLFVYSQSEMNDWWRHHCCQYKKVNNAPSVYMLDRSVPRRCLMTCQVCTIDLKHLKPDCFRLKAPLSLIDWRLQSSKVGYVLGVIISTRRTFWYSMLK